MIRLISRFASFDSFKEMGFTAVDVVISGKRKLFTTVDIDDAFRVLGYRVQAVSHRRVGRVAHYAYLNLLGEDGKWHPLYLHRLFLGLIDERLGDHADRNSLNNRRGNLRIANVPQNGANKTPIATRHGLPKGVRLDRRQKRKGFSAQINVNGCVLYLGYHTTAQEAADAYDAAALKHHGEFAVTNKMLRDLARAQS